MTCEIYFWCAWTWHLPGHGVRQPWGRWLQNDDGVRPDTKERITRIQSLEGRARSSSWWVWGHGWPWWKRWLWGNSNRRGRWWSERQGVIDPQGGVTWTWNQGRTWGTQKIKKTKEKKKKWVKVFDIKWVQKDWLNYQLMMVLYFSKMLLPLKCASKHVCQCQFHPCFCLIVKSFQDLIAMTLLQDGQKGAALWGQAWQGAIGSWQRTWDRTAWRKKKEHGPNRENWDTGLQRSWDVNKYMCKLSVISFGTCDNL